MDFQLRRQRKRKKKLIIILLFIFAGTICLYVVFNQFIKNEQSSSANRTNDSVVIINPLSQVSPTYTESNSLKEVVDNALEGTKGTYGIVIKNLKNGQSYYANEHKVFEAGSLYKLWIMTTVYKQIQSGQLKEDQILSEDVAMLNQKFEIDPDSAEETEGTVTFTVYDALYQMITISHNYAALLLTEKVKLSSVATFLKENGFTESRVGINSDFPTATASDIALFYEKLYKQSLLFSSEKSKGELVNQQYTIEMIDLLKNQQLNNGLPKYLPKDLSIAHKTGEIDFFKHDSGIVYTDFGDYIIVVMSESDSPLGAQERIALVSKGAFDYFTSEQ